VQLFSPKKKNLNKLGPYFDRRFRSSSDDKIKVNTEKTETVEKEKKNGPNRIHRIAVKVADSLNFFFASKLS